MRILIVPVLIALALTGCSSGAAPPIRTAADSTCESGERILKLRPKLFGIRKHGIRWQKGDCLTVAHQPITK